MSLTAVASSAFQMTNFYGFILGHGSGVVCTANRMHMAAAIWGTIVFFFFCHLGSTDHRELVYLFEVPDFLM
jgi:hypothetical protein